MVQLFGNGRRAVSRSKDAKPDAAVSQQQKEIETAKRRALQGYPADEREIVDLINQNMEDDPEYVRFLKQTLAVAKRIQKSVASINPSTLRTEAQFERAENDIESLEDILTALQDY